MREFSMTSPCSYDRLDGEVWGKGGFYCDVHSVSGGDETLCSQLGQACWREVPPAEALRVDQEVDDGANCTFTPRFAASFLLAVVFKRCWFLLRSSENSRKKRKV